MLPQVLAGTWPLAAGSGPSWSWPWDHDSTQLPDPYTVTGPGDLDPLQRSTVEVASDLLWRLSACQFGLCQELVRPCRRPCTPGWPDQWSSGIGGQWLPVACRCSPLSTTCACGGVRAIALPGPLYWESPVPGQPPLVRVVLDGVPLRDGYTVTPEGVLIRGGGQLWPACQDLGLPLEEHGTWGVRYWRGVPVPPGGRAAMSQLADELLTARRGGDSALPARIQSIMREGVEYTLLDHDFLRDGRTGLTAVDLWLSAVNPRRLARPPEVVSVDQLTGASTSGRPW